MLCPQALVHDQLTCPTLLERSDPLILFGKSSAFKTLFNTPPPQAFPHFSCPNPNAFCRPLYHTPTLPKKERKAFNSYYSWQLPLSLSTQAQLSF